MTTRYEMPDGRLYDLDDNNVLWNQKVSEGGAGTDWQELAKPGDPIYVQMLMDVLIRGKVVKEWE
jgi:hypothetical protein